MNTSHYRITAVLLLIEALLIFAPMVILGGAIDWPTSLDEPASVMLPRIQDNEAAVFTGYFIYLIYSILFWPVALMLTRIVAQQDTFSPILKIAAGFGIASAVARTLGIIRWLLPMPMLADKYTDPTTSAQTQETISVVYDMLNDYAGAIGEQLGVSLFAALWLTLVSIVIVRSSVLPRWLGGFGLVAAASLYTNLLELAGVDLGAFLTVSVSIIHVWLLAAAVVVFRADNQTV